MSVENIDILKPESKQVSHLDVIGKYRDDLEYLKNGKMSIERQMLEKGVSDPVIDKKLAKLNKSIETLQFMISEFEEKHS